MTINTPPLEASWRWAKGYESSLRLPFNGASNLDTNFSQAWQDIFILSMLAGKISGTYLEIGGHDPVSNNNTYLLHQKFGWRGVTLELDPLHFSAWRHYRPSGRLVLADATTIDYAEAIPKWFESSIDRIDYLQLDIDPSFNTLKVLKKLPLDKYRFSIITFETDIYAGDNRAREESRAILHSHGYKLVAPDVCVYFQPAGPNPIPFEDWWVDPLVIDIDKIDELQKLTEKPLLPQHLLFKTL